MNGAYRELAEQHPELMTECECRLAWLKSCGCISGSCPWCDDAGRRPKRLDELLAMLEEVVAKNRRSVPESDAPEPGWARRYVLAMLVERARPDRYPQEPIEEAAARLWMAVVGREVRT